MQAHTYILTHLHTYIPTYLHSYIHTYLHTYLPTYLHTYIHTYTHTYLPTYLPTYIHSYIHTYIQTHTHLPTYLPTYIHTYIPTHLHTYIRTYVHTYLPIYIHSLATITVWVSSRISGGVNPPKEGWFSKSSNLLKWCFRSSPNFLQNKFWRPQRPLSCKILIFWVVQVPKIQKHNFSISGSTCIDFLVVLDFLERHWQVITTNNMIFGCIWVRLKT